MVFMIPFPSIIVEVARFVRDANGPTILGRLRKVPPLADLYHTLKYPASQKIICSKSGTYERHALSIYRAARTSQR